MAASVSTSPAQPKVGQAVLISGDGFAASTVCTVSVLEADFSAQVTSDASGALATSDIADHATGTLTVTGQPVAAETVTIGAQTYTWRASVTTTANEVLIGATAAASLQNLRDAVNLTGTPGTQYGSATTKNASVEAYNNDATHVYLRAITGGTAGNSLATTETMTLGSFGGGTLSGGSAATSNVDLTWTPIAVGTFTVQITDGTTTARASVRVWSE